MSPEARGSDRAAAEAFARHYVDLVNYSSATGETAALEAAGTSACKSCAAIAGNVREIYDRGGRIESQGWTIEKIKAVRLTSARAAVLQLSVRQSAETVRKKRNGPTESFDGGMQPMVMHLRSNSSEWVVDRLDLVE